MNDMKRSILLSLSVLGLLFAACQKNGPVGGGEDNSGEIVRQYLSLNIVPTGGVATRADEEYTQGGGTYKDGTETESTVSSIRFYFFDENGGPVEVGTVTGGTDPVSYIDWTSPVAGDPDHSETVENKLVTLLLNKKPTAALPTHVVAVLNAVADGGNMVSLATLRGAGNDKDYLTGRTESGKFVMSNSVYLEGAEPHYATEVSSHYASSESEAMTNPVKIYVERVLARVDLKIGMTAATVGGKTAYLTSSDEYDVTGESGEQTEEEIYVEFLNWGLTGTSNVSRLVKEINAEWTDEGLFGSNAASEPWNVAAYHRSFWAVNAPAATQSYLSYDGITGTIPAAGEFATAYLQENASPASAPAAAPAEPSMVILKARLLDKNGEVLKLAKWANRYYTLDGLKKSIANGLELYKKTSDATSGDKYDKIDPADLDFVFTGNDKYYVDVVLAAASESAVWCVGKGENAGDPLGKDAVNSYIKERVGHVQVWRDGQTYYYFEIRHLGGTVQGSEDDEPSPAYYGVVRNHIYEATVKTVTGLGTPVYEPDSEIDPPIHTEDEGMLAAEVRVLSWRVVRHDVDLTW